MPDSPPPPIGFRSEFMGFGAPESPSYDPPLASLSYAMPMPSFPPAPGAPTSPSSSSTSEASVVNRWRNPISFDVAGYCWQYIPSGGTFPLETAVRAGRDADGSTIYVGRAFHEGDMLPAKVIPDKFVAFVAFGGEEHPKEDYEILRTGDFVWEFAVNGEVPPGAVEGGQTADGEKLYIGRCLHNGTQTPGKVQPSHECLYIPFDGEEVRVSSYEVLVIK